MCIRKKTRGSKIDFLYVKERGAHNNSNNNNKEGAGMYFSFFLLTRKKTCNKILDFLSLICDAEEKGRVEERHRQESRNIDGRCN